MTEKKSFRVPVWLLLSLIINALLIGMIIGGGIGKRRGGGPPAAGGSEAQIAVGIQNALTGEDRTAFRRAMRAAFMESQVQRRALNATRLELGQLLIADPYDREAVEAAFARLREADGDVKARVHVELAAQLEELSAEQRQAVLKSLTNRDRSSRDSRERRDGRRDDQRGLRPDRPQLRDL